MSNRISLQIRFLALVLPLLVVTPGIAQSAPPIADTYIASSKTSTNYGSQSTLVVQTGTQTFLKFDLSAIPSGISVSKATLRLYLNGVTASGNIDIFPIFNSWSEGTLTYKNAPLLGGSATGGHPATLSSSNLNQFVIIDITQLVQDWVSGIQPNYGLALALGGATGSFSFDSKESIATSHQPELEIASTGSAGPQGIQGPQGLIGPPGPAGPTGPQGQTGAQGPGVGFTFRNSFSPPASYAINDAVTYSGSTYVAIAASQGPNNPAPSTNPTAWSLIAQAGATGPAGTQGPPGPIGSTGPPGTTGPQGLAGPTGPQGLSGPIGSTGPPGASGPQGPAGPIGPQGPPAPLPITVIHSGGSPYSMAGMTGFYWNNSGSTFTWNLDAPTAGKQYCFGNYSGQTGALIIASANGIFIVYEGVNGAATNGTLVSSGAKGDFICLVGVDSTHYAAAGAGYGSWTNR